MDIENISKQIAESRQRFQHYQPIILLETIIKQQTKPVVPPYSLLHKQAPLFSMVDYYDKPFYLDSLRGKFVLLNFWASWNQQSKEENQTIARAYRWYRRHNLEVVSVSFDSTMHPWKRAIEIDNLPWKQVADFKEMHSPLVSKYNIKDLPFNVIIDTTGKIIAADLKGRDLTLKLNEILPK